MKCALAMTARAEGGEDWLHTLGCGCAVETAAGSGSMSAFCRIDYHLATPALAALARQTGVYKHEKFSDHAPLSVRYDLTI